jgi:phenylalanyl-tRNA synthetase beta chain
MRVSINWLNRLLGTSSLGISATELQARLSLRVAEVEGELESSGADLAGVVVGRVLSCLPHPGADKLRLTTVDIGAERPLRIVCGAPNVAAGQTVAVATIGAKVSVTGRDGARTTVTIKKVDLRGEASEGMLCAQDELGLGSSHDGIMVLDPALRPGLPLREALQLSDTVLVIENHAITNRPDLWGQLGWAREVAAMLGLARPAEPDLRLPPGAPGGASRWSVELADDGCSAYAGAVVEGVANGASPAWLQALLESAGIRPLGLLVDITNLVMLELGQPMHAFDARAISGTRITVRAAHAGEALTTLDGKALALGAGDLVIADAAQALALAGVMGGAASMVHPDTASVVLEAAVFRPERIRRTRKRSGLATDSSARFEKGLYPELAPAAINRALALLAELCPGSRVASRFAAGRFAGTERRIRFAPDQLTRITGLELPWAAQQELLGRLGFSCTGNEVEVPWWRRKDVTVAADLVEEVARSHGYQHIQPETPRLPAGAPIANPLRALEHRCRRLMSALGWDEVATYAFTSQQWVDELALVQQPVRLAHPLSSEQNVMRPSLAPNLLQAVANNLRHQRTVAIYEIGKRYGESLNRGHPGRDPHEEVMIAGAYAAVDDQSPFYAVRDAASALLGELGYAVRCQAQAAGSAPARWLTPGRTALLQLGKAPERSGTGHAIGLCGELARTLRERAGSSARVGYFEISLEDLAGSPLPPIAFRAPSRFPVVERQFTWDCPEDLAFAELETPMRQAAGELYAGIALDSIYRGEQLAAGRKAVSLRIFLQSDQRTLEEKDLLGLQGRIISSIEKRTPARLRQ